jgi:hypothetical protein
MTFVGKRVEELEAEFSRILQHEYRGMHPEQIDEYLKSHGLEGSTHWGPWFSSGRSLKLTERRTEVSIGVEYTPTRDTKWLACTIVVRLRSPEFDAVLFHPMVRRNAHWQLRIREHGRKGLKTFSKSFKETFPRLYKTRVYNNRILATPVSSHVWTGWILERFRLMAGISAPRG